MSMRKEYKQPQAIERNAKVRTMLLAGSDNYDRTPVGGPTDGFDARQRVPSQKLPQTID